MAFGRFASIDMSVTVGLVGRLDLDKQLWLKPRLPKDLHFLFGGWTTSASNNLLKYNCRAAKWRVMVNRHTTASLLAVTSWPPPDSVLASMCRDHEPVAHL
ncbi:uncharacterized protein LOC125942461 [Dermacentor silvarum]|uniref:uncharacterized protein LOC125942461 n=1 Tax=Dermacentor silvarum TaxID=543639 RepID=UPI0021008452|nr:uncharacterized protein LOC125942461 [Dermacentor silvarum]